MNWNQKRVALKTRILKISFLRNIQLFPTIFKFIQGVYQSRNVKIFQNQASHLEQESKLYYQEKSRSLKIQTPHTSGSYVFIINTCHS